MLTARVYFNSAWVLFSPLSHQEPVTVNKKSSNSLGFISDNSSRAIISDPSKEFRPMAFFGKTFSPVDKHEQNMIRGLRKWLQITSKTMKFVDDSKVTQLAEMG